MGREKEPLDSLTGRIATGIHQVATFVIVAPSSTREELDLASLILRRDPNRSAPRESASAVETFNRLLDVAIDSANETAGCGTRAERRARLCAALERERVVFIDSDTLAGLIDVKIEHDAQLGYVLEAPVLEALEPSAEELEVDDGPTPFDDMSEEECRELVVCCLEAPRSPPNCPCAGEQETDGILSLGPPRYDPDDDAGVVSLEFMGGDRHADFNPSVND